MKSKIIKLILPIVLICLIFSSCSHITNIPSMLRLYTIDGVERCLKVNGAVLDAIKKKDYALLKTAFSKDSLARVEEKDFIVGANYLFNTLSEYMMTSTSVYSGGSSWGTDNSYEYIVSVNDININSELYSLKIHYCFYSMENPKYYEGVTKIILVSDDEYEANFDKFAQYINKSEEDGSFGIYHPKWLGQSQHYK